MGWTDLRAVSIACLAGLVVATGCRDSTAPLLLPTADREALERLGFPAELAKEYGDHYAVDGDIIVSKRALAASSLTSHAPRRQYVVDEVSGPTWNYAPINVYFADLEAQNPAWGAAARMAIEVWSTTPGAKVPLLETPDRAAADLIIERGACDSPTALGCAAFPMGSDGYEPSVGHHISITYPGDTLAPNQKLYVMAHEIGHTIGFRHSNWWQRGEPEWDPSAHGANLVAGTPSSDPNSLMNGIIAPWQGLSYYDRVAARSLWAGGRGPTPTGTMSGTRAALSWPAVQDAHHYRVIYARSRWTTCWDAMLGTTYCIEWEYHDAGTTTDTSFVDIDRGVSGSGSCFYPNVMYQIVSVFVDPTKTHATDVGDPTCYN